MLTITGSAGALFIQRLTASMLESVARNFTAKIDRMSGLNYWARLHPSTLLPKAKEKAILHQIPLEGGTGLDAKVQGNIFPEFYERLPDVDISTPKPSSYSCEERQRVFTTLCFTTTPQRKLRDTIAGSTDMFNARLDEWLSTVPDQQKCS